MPTKINKFLLLFLLFFGLLAISLGYFQIKGAIYAPFVRQKVSEEQEIPTQAEVLAILDGQDVDNDGLSDFDEKFVYQTSAYLADSDSDGFSDKEEIEAESDPLNPESTPYHSPTNLPGEPGKSSTSVLEEVILVPEFSQTLGIEISVEEIRNLLINQAGLSQGIVDKLDDKTLEKLYNETKQETGIDLKELKAPDDLMRQFSDLDVVQLRQLLISQGVDSEILSSIDDQTLKSMFLQSLLNLGVE